MTYMPENLKFRPSVKVSAGLSHVAAKPSSHPGSSEHGEAGSER
jgi:hypothetical protein